MEISTSVNLCDRLSHKFQTVFFFLSFRLKVLISLPYSIDFDYSIDLDNKKKIQKSIYLQSNYIQKFNQKVLI